jgi:hypothetical protein
VILFSFSRLPDISAVPVEIDIAITIFANRFFYNGSHVSEMRELSPDQEQRFVGYIIHAGSDTVSFKGLSRLKVHREQLPGKKISPLHPRFPLYICSGDM